ncbi:MAG: FtsQ-type POTRA domain-containing protein [bacterium]|nr:FtsQ-type POTRA domain-containing protein [bacterium]
MNPFVRLFSRDGAGRRGRTPQAVAAARAKRARDHLAHKRDQERLRLERDRVRPELLASRRRLFRVLSPVAFVAAIVLGSHLALPVTEFLVLGDARLERVAVQGAAALPAALIAASTGAIAGQPLDDLDPASIEAMLVADPWIEDAGVLRLPTGTLLVRVVERDAIARWRIDEEMAWVDATGRRFSGTGSDRMLVPTVAGASLEPGALPDGALQILDALKRHPELTSELDALTLHLPALEADADGVLRDSPAGFVLQIGQEGPRALLGRRLLSQRVARLAVLLDHDEEALATARLIDLRYADRAVLRTAPASG